MKPAIVFAMLACLLAIARAQTSPDLPSYVGNSETIADCSLIIPMDDSQGSATNFNLKSYGLVNHLLYKNIAVKWVIRSGKTKVSTSTGALDQTDFSANVSMLFPTSSSDTTMKDFKAGAFIVPLQYCQGSVCSTADEALQAIQEYGNNVTVFLLEAPVTVEVRYNLTKRPLIGILNDGQQGYVHRAMLLEAGFLECASSSCSSCPAVDSKQCHFFMIDTNTTQLDANICASAITEAEFEPGYPQAVPYVSAIRSYVLAGGNFFAESGAIPTYEMCDPVQGTLPVCSSQYSQQVPSYFLSTNGLQVLKATDGASSNITFEHASAPVSQFYGAWERNTAGSVPQYRLYKSIAATSQLQNNGFNLIGMDGTESYIASQAKLNMGDGSNVFYMAGSNYCNATSDYTAGVCSQSLIGNMINGVRFFLNAMLIPSNRTTECAFDIQLQAQVNNSLCGCNSVLDKSTPPQCCKASALDVCGICNGDGKSCPSSSSTGHTTATGGSTGNHTTTTGSTSGRGQSPSPPVDTKTASASATQSSFSLTVLLIVALMLFI